MGRATDLFMRIHFHRGGVPAQEPRPLRVADPRSGAHLSEAQQVHGFNARIASGKSHPDSLPLAEGIAAFESQVSFDARHGCQLAIILPRPADGRGQG